VKNIPVQWEVQCEAVTMYGYNDEQYGEGPSARSYNPITISRLMNILLIGLFAVAIVFHVVCLSVMAAKHNEFVDKFSGELDHVKESCILFVDFDEKDNSVKWVNNRCDIVIYGSGALAGCALLMIIFLVIRTIVFRK